MSNGRIFQINLSKGGVPKLGQHEGQVTALGLTGDGHDHPNVHGGPEAALCLYSLELIQALQAEGHPIFPGPTGENLTLSGLDWAQVTPGRRLRLGSEVLIEITLYTTPCSAIRSSFSDRNSNRIRVDEHPGWSRAYARVLQPGCVRIGDPVVIVQGE
jgi:MOSC domain-containing protein YiiM